MTANDYPRCATCEHWLGEEWDEEGGCNVLRYDSQLTFQTEGRSTYIDRIETPPDFGCINHSEIEKE